MTTRDYNKNKNNAVLAKQMKTGDRVVVICTGETGVVTKIVEYNRDNSNWDSLMDILVSKCYLKVFLITKR